MNEIRIKTRKRKCFASENSKMYKYNLINCKLANKFSGAGGVHRPMKINLNEFNTK